MTLTTTNSTNSQIVTSLSSANDELTTTIAQDAQDVEVVTVNNGEVEVEGATTTTEETTDINSPIEPEEGEELGTPFGVSEDLKEHEKHKRRCRCIQKKHGKMLKEITYIPMEPIVQNDGAQKRAFACNCTHLKRVHKPNIQRGNGFVFGKENWD